MPELKKQTLLGLIIIFLCFSCNTKNTHKNTDTDTIKIVNGKVYGKIPCSKDATITYSLYIPTDYDKDRSSPVIFLFDPHADGKLPVDLLKDEAERFGYIIVGSNNSKNGIGWETNSKMIDILFDEIYSKYNIDKRRVYTMGFSGGSRVASQIAILKGGINGVIGCGAGFPNINQPIQNKFNYIGFVGNTDFNLFEMNNLDKDLVNMDYTHYIQIFNGKHEWPPRSEIVDAFTWIEFNATRDNLISRKDTLLMNTLLSYQKKLELYNKNKDTYNEYLMYKKIICFFNKLTDITEYEKKLKEIEASSELIGIIQKKKQIESREIQLQQTYSEAMLSKDTTWWSKEIVKFNKQKNDTGKIEESLMMKRTLAYLSLVAYMNSSGALNANNYNDASKFIAIYGMVDPNNVDQCYFEACLNSLQGNTDKAFGALEKAISLGFKDKDRMLNDNMLNNLKGLAKYQEILGEMTK